MSAVIYHVGNLSLDRIGNRELHRRAEEYLRRGTPRGQPVRPWKEGPGCVRGTGEGSLVQVRLTSDSYEYRYIPNQEKRTNGN